MGVFVASGVAAWPAGADSATRTSATAAVHADRTVRRLTAALRKLRRRAASLCCRTSPSRYARSGRDTYVSGPFRAPRMWAIALPTKRPRPHTGSRRTAVPRRDWGSADTTDCGAVDWRSPTVRLRGVRCSTPGCCSWTGRASSAEHLEARARLPTVLLRGRRDCLLRRQGPTTTAQIWNAGTAPSATLQRRWWQRHLR